MDRYVGLDAHSQTCTFAVMGRTGKRLTSKVVETNGRALVDAVRSLYVVKSIRTNGSVS